MPQPVDRLFVHCRELVTLCGGPARGLRRGADLEAGLGVVQDGAVAVKDGKVVATGTTQEIRAQWTSVEEIDCSDYVVTPGFVDAHTHPAWVATREEEFHMRCAGADYMAIAAAGGGILRSVRSLRDASEKELRDHVQRHYDGFLAHGTTTIEAKSGYGLTLDDEVRSLDAITAVAETHPLTVSRTFLGAHEFPPEYRDRRDDYVRLVIEEMLPAVVGKAESCDVFAEPKVFDRNQSREILEAAKALGFRLRLHADEIEPMGGAELAVEVGADSADHLPRISLAGQDALAESDTCAVLLPGTSFYLGKPAHAPARSMLDKGCAVALATDFNPGSCHTQSIPLIVTLGCVLLHMSVAECLTAITINPAASLHLDGEVGSLHPGKRADLAILDLPNHKAFGYAFGGNPVVMTVKDGVPVVTNVCDRGYDRG